MKDSMRAAGFITLFALMMPLGSARAEEKLSKEKWAEAQQIMGHVVLSARRYLTEEENKALSDLLNKGLERKYLKQSEKMSHKKGAGKR